MIAPSSDGEAAEPLVAVLAGGLGRRLGGEKPAAELGGRPLIEHALAATSAAGLRAVVVAHADSPLPALSAPVLIEPPGVRHPLWGLAAALHSDEGRGSGVLALGCDMPFVSAALLRDLAQLQARTVAISVDGRLQPLPARYAPAHAAALEAAAVSGLAMGETLEQLGATVLDEAWLRRYGDPVRLLFSVNEPADLRRARRWLE